MGEGIGRMGDSRSKTKREATEKDKKAVLSLTSFMDTLSGSLCGMPKDCVKWILSLFLTTWFVRVGLKHARKEVGI